MGKAKKGRKVDHEEDLDGTVSGDAEGFGEEEVASKAKTKKEKKVKEAVAESDSDDEQQQSKKQKKKKKGKAGSESVDDATVELEELSISAKPKKEKKKSKIAHAESGDETAEVEKSNKAPKKKGKKKGSESESEEEVKKPDKGGFAVLALSDDEQPPEVPSDHSEQEVIETKKELKDNKKGGKKSKKKKKDEEEDLEQILAELELEYSGNAPPKVEAEDHEEKEEETKKSKKKKKEEKKEEVKEEVEEERGDENAEEMETSGLKTAAQKKKEKKEREKQKRLAEKSKPQGQAQQEKEKSETPEPEVKQEEKAPEVPEEDEEGDDDDKKKKKKKKGKDEKKEEKKGVPNKKTIAAMQEALRKIKEEEEKLAILEAERLKKEEEAEKAKLEQLRLEQERKDRKKAKEKERKERLKAEGKLLSSKQKQGRARAEAMIEAMKARYGTAATGGPVPAPPKPKPFTKLKKKKPQEGGEPEGEPGEENNDQSQLANKIEVEIVDAKVKSEQEADDDVKDSWDAESSGDEAEKSEEIRKEKVGECETVMKGEEKEGGKEKGKKEDTESDSCESDESESASESDCEEEERGKTDAEKKRERAVARIKQRHEDAEKNKTVDELRAAVVCVLGHVDTGKTKILDKLRRTNVQDGEAGGITQQIGATNVPIEAIQEQGRFVKGFSSMELKIPGLLIIDTPGHESFSNLRSRGSSLCDIAILVVDIMHGLEPQTIESLNLLKNRKTPFVVALNKIDRLYDWQTMSKRDVRDIIKAQAPNTQLEFEQRVNDVIVQFAEQGLNSSLFYDNPDVRSYVSLVPTSAITGEGMGNLLAYIVESCQTMLAKRLMFSEELQATVLEVKAISGLGTTIDVILVNGRLREGDTVVLAGTEAPIVTQIRSLLMPQPLKELRVKNAYVEHKEVKAAQGVKIAAKDLEKVIAGLNLRVAVKADEVEILREEVGRELKSALSSIKLQERGVYVQASTLGSLEALLEFLRTSSIPYSGIRIGPVVKKDVMKASTMLEHDSQYATILAFDVKIERDAQELADTLGVKIFQADIIYHLFDKFMAYREELKQKKRDEFKSIAVFPCKLRILPQYVFNSRDPIVMGVVVEAGIVKEGTPLCVPSKDFVEIGIVSGIESNHKPVESARKGQEVCVKIEPIPGEAPKMFGRHFDDKDFLISKISRQSIDACKDYFRDDLVKTDWQLMVELKKLFQIL